MDNVEFFDDDVICAYCDAETRGVVWEHSGTICCGECDGIIFDARDTSGTVVILELEDTGKMH